MFLTESTSVSTTLDNDYNLSEMTDIVSSIIIAEQAATIVAMQEQFFLNEEGDEESNDEGVLATLKRWAIKIYEAIRDALIRFKNWIMSFFNKIDEGNKKTDAKIAEISKSPVPKSITISVLESVSTGKGCTEISKEIENVIKKLNAIPGTDIGQNKFSRDKYIGQKKEFTISNPLKIAGENSKSVREARSNMDNLKSKLNDVEKEVARLTGAIKGMKDKNKAASLKKEMTGFKNGLTEGLKGTKVFVESTVAVKASNDSLVGALWKARTSK